MSKRNRKQTQFFKPSVQQRTVRKKNLKGKVATIKVGNNDIELEVVNDYDGFFERYTRSVIQQKIATGEPFLCKRVIVKSGPWKPYAVQWEKKNSVLTLDYYSLTRTFGGLDIIATTKIMAAL